MKRYIVALILVISALSITACAEEVKVQPYERQEPTTSTQVIELEEETTESETEQVEEETEKIEEEQTEEVESTQEEDTDNQESEQDEEFIDNGAISDRNLSMGKAYIGKIEFTSEKIAELFPILSNYTENELTQQVVESIANYLNNYSEYKLINLWQEYESLEKQDRYALIILTRYEQSFGGYSKSNMGNTLNGNETYKSDLKNIDNEIQ